MTVAVAALALAPSAALAQAPADDAALLEVYTVSGLPVRAEGDTIVQARDRALAQGQQQALRRLLQRLTLAEDHGRLPAPTVADTEAMVLSLSISDERTPPRGYVASLTVSFMPEGVQALLEQADVPYADRRGPPLVVVPVWQAGPDARATLWQTPNPWRRAWDERRAGGGLVPLDVPLGDGGDVMALDVDQVLIGDEAALDAFAERYATAGVLIAIAQVQGGAEGGAPAQVRVDARTTGATVEPVGFTTIQPLAPDLPPEEALPAALVEAAAAVARQVDEAWKMRAVGFSVATAQLTALVTLEGGLGEWLDVQRRLGRAIAVNETQVQAMTRDRAQVVLRFSGTEEQLAESLARQGLSLRDAGGYWALDRLDLSGTWR